MVVEIVSLQSNKEVVGVGEDVDFSVETSPIDYYNDINWSGGGLPATQSGGQTFTTSWNTPGTKTVTASCGSSSISKEVEVINGLTVVPRNAYVGVDGQKSFAAWTFENGSAIDVTSSSTFTTSKGDFEDNVLTASLTPSDSIGADWVKATYDDVTTDADYDCDLTVFEVESITEAISPTNNTNRTILGIGETVTCYTNPPIEVEWTVSGDGGIEEELLYGLFTIYLAEMSPGNGTVHAKIGGGEAVRPFSIIPPESISYTKLYDDPEGLVPWVSGDKYLAARTWFKATVNPTTVSFYNAKIYENLGSGTTDEWPDGTTWNGPNGLIGPIEIDFKSQFPDQLETAKYNSNRLYNGSSWEHFTPTFPIPWVYRDQSGELVPFYTAFSARYFHHGNWKTSVMVDYQYGGLQGPWQE